MRTSTGLGPLLIPTLRVGDPLDKNTDVGAINSRQQLEKIQGLVRSGVPLGLAYRLLPGPPSLLGVSLAHIGATCGYIGPGPWLLHRLGLL